MAGFPGCVGSGDGTHIAMLRCPFRLSELNKSYKLGCPARTFNIFVSHDRRGMSSTRGHPATTNDKSLIKFDDFAVLIKEGKLFGEEEFYFQLEEKQQDGSIKKVWYRGCYTLVDGGYLSWPTLIAPLSAYLTYDEMRWSKWLESMRKDVECTFGILKVRFQVLKKGISLHGTDACDNTFLCCLALHNMILDADVAARATDDDVEDTDSMDDDDSFVDDETPMNLDLPDVLKDFADDNGVICVTKLSLKYFQSKLIEHHSIQHHAGKLIWPSTSGLPPPDNIVEHS